MAIPTHGRQDRHFLCRLITLSAHCRAVTPRVSDDYVTLTRWKLAGSSIFGHRTAWTAACPTARPLAARRTAASTFIYYHLRSHLALGAIASGEPPVLLPASRVLHIVCVACRSGNCAVSAMGNIRSPRSGTMISSERTGKDVQANQQAVKTIACHCHCAS